MRDEDKPHKTGLVECRICGGRHISVWPVDIIDEDMQECLYCGHMTCGPVEEDD